jgi:uncharacterized membrane protein (DUF106 family)
MKLFKNKNWKEWGEYVLDKDFNKQYLSQMPEQKNYIKEAQEKINEHELKKIEEKILSLKNLQSNMKRQFHRK